MLCLTDLSVSLSQECRTCHMRLVNVVILHDVDSLLNFAGPDLLDKQVLSHFKTPNKTHK